MHPPLPVLLHSIVEGRRLPGLGEEDERDGLSEVVELETARAHGVHHGRVVDHLRRDLKIASAEKEVGVSSGSAQTSRKESAEGQ